MSTITEARKVVKDRERTAREAEVKREAERLEAEARRERARGEHMARVTAMKEAEAALRQHEGATVLEVRFFGVKVTGRLEASADPLLRQQVTHAMTESVFLLQAAFEERVGQVRAGAVGREMDGTWTAEYVVKRLRDACRHGVASGLVTVERAD